MKYICLGYLEPGRFGNMSESERHTMLDCEANALVEQEFEPASDRLVLGNGLRAPCLRERLKSGMTISKPTFQYQPERALPQDL